MNSWAHLNISRIFLMQCWSNVTCIMFTKFPDLALVTPMLLATKRVGLHAFHKQNFIIKTSPGHLRGQFWYWTIWNITTSHTQIRNCGILLTLSNWLNAIIVVSCYLLRRILLFFRPLFDEHLRQWRMKWTSSYNEVFEEILTVKSPTICR